MKTYVIEEIATYYVQAENEEAAEKKFLDSITIPKRAGILCEVNEREVYEDPENRLVKKEPKKKTR